ncbi:hypothetical protein Barb7_01411 [Bacteroidales bacterium Barb7]|nr:hypothetical protein Barb7_01411 [Bacteroidales bacterium Barb7]
MKRRITVMLTCLICIFQAMEAEIVNDFDYKLDTLNQTATLIHNLGYSSENSILSIPEKIVADGIVYTVTDIGDNVFEELSWIKSLNLPSSLKTIGKYAFHKCSSLSSVTLHEGITHLGEWAFGECQSLTSIVVPSSIQTLEDCVFRDCKGLQSAIIKEGVTTIGNYAFAHTISLTSVTIPGSVTTIGNYAFDHTISLTSVTIPGGVTTIGKNAFSDCSSLTSITIPDNVTSLGDSAFYRCYVLGSITIPSSIKSWGSGVFHSCNSLKSVILEEGMTAVGEAAFAFCDSLESVTWPHSMAKIGKSAFSHCANLKSLTLPDDVREIEELAFSYCPQLGDIYLECTRPDTFEIILGDSLFDNTPDVKIHIPKGSEKYYEKNASGEGFTWYNLPITLNCYFVTVRATDPAFDSKMEITVSDSAYNKPVTVTATSLYGRIVKWTDEIGHIFDGDSISFILEEDRVFIVELERYTSTVTIDADRYGNLQAITDSICFYGDLVTIPEVLTSDFRFRFKEWINWHNGQSLSTDNPLSFVVTRDTAMRATFEQYRFSVKAITSDPNKGRISQGMDSTVLYTNKDQITVASSPADRYTFQQWINEDGLLLSTDNPYSFYPVRDMTITAVFAADTTTRKIYKVEFSAGSGGEIVSGANGNYSHNESVTVKAGAYEHYRFVKWVDKYGTSLSADNPYTFLVTSDMTVRASFRLETYNVTLRSKDADRGTIKDGDEALASVIKQVEYGQTLKVEALPKLGFRFVNWEMDNSIVFYQNPYRLDVTNHATLVANFAPQSSCFVTALVNDPARGRVIVRDSSFYKGETVALKAAPSYGWHFEKWTRNGIELSDKTDSLTFDIQEDVVIQALFAPDIFQFTVLAAEPLHGIVVSENRGNSPYLTQVKIAASPAANYHFAQWESRNGDILSLNASSTFTLTRDTAVFAIFAPDTVQISALYHPELGTVTGTGTYIYGTEATVTAEAAQGFHFIQWTTTDGTYLSDKETYTFTVKSEITLMPNFVEDTKPEGNLALPDGKAAACYTDGTLHLVNLEGSAVTIATVSGRKVLQFNVRTAREQYPAALPAGIYILSGKAGNNLKFIVR